MGAKPTVFNWREISTAEPQGSILGPLCFLEYIYDLAAFADDTSLSTPVEDFNSAASDLNHDLE